MIAILISLLFVSSLSADDLVGAWYGEDSDGGDVHLILNRDDSFSFSFWPSRVYSDSLVNGTLRSISSYGLDDLVEAGLAHTVVREVHLKGDFVVEDGEIRLNHPTDQIFNISGHLFDVGEFFAFLASSVLAADVGDLSEGEKEGLIFLTDNYMVEVILGYKEEDQGMFSTVFPYELDGRDLTLHDSITGKEWVLRGPTRSEPTGVEPMTWGEVKGIPGGGR